jgi:ATP-dependent helicase HrpB
LSETDFLKAVFAGYPDRVAARRAPRSSRVHLATGTGAIVGSESGVVEGEFLVALDLQAAGRQPGGNSQTVSEPIVRLASVVERDWLRPNNLELVHRFDADTGAVKATRVHRYDALVVAERPESPDPLIAAALLADAWRRRGPTADDTRLLRRLRFAGQADVDLDTLLRVAVRDARSLSDVRLARAVPAHVVHALDRDAPESLRVPSGRTVGLEYADDGSLSASVKLQELFGLGETPRIGPRKEPVLFALLAPNGRPVQITRDLRSFWERTYPEVRKELRGRYPNHPWPEDPWSAPPTRRAKPRVRRE